MKNQTHKVYYVDFKNRRLVHVQCVITTVLARSWLASVKGAAK